jgi:Holliday junction DNA helicase RuvB
MQNLRPTSLKEFIGQKRVIEELSIYINSVKQRRDAFPHTLFIGAPGLGKTTLSRIIALELRRNLKQTSGPVLEKPGIIASLLTSLRDGDILFIDEVHRIPKVCQEILYTAMEDFALDIVIGKGSASKTIRLMLPKFTLIGATNKPNLCLPPLLDRFQLVFKLDFYDEAELAEIIERAGKELGLNLERQASLLLAKAGKGIPRQALNLLRRLDNYLNGTNQGLKDLITVDTVREFLSLLDIDEWGLSPEDRRYLFTLYYHFNGGPAGLESLALTSQISPSELETIFEPPLIRLGLVSRTRRGRVLTELGKRYILEKGLVFPKRQPNVPF